MSRSIVVTGAAGFIGSWTIKQLLENGWTVTAFDRTPDDSKLRSIAGDGPADAVTWRAGDIAEPDDVNALFRAAAPEMVIHLAAVLIPVCRDDPVTGARIDVIGHINIFEAAPDAGCHHVVYASSAAATARGNNGALKTVYGTYKHWNEEYAATRLHDRGIASVGLRPAIVYGPGRESGATAFVNDAIAAAVAGEDYLLPTRWCHRVEYVEEVAETFVRCAETEIRGAHASDITENLTDEHDLIAALQSAIPGCRITAPTQGKPGSPGTADCSPLAGLIGPLNHISLNAGVVATVVGMRARAPGT
ncbi:MAG: NAD(P)-dependent oxidoreductase [Rhodospirillaceae bacterium]|nr:NAD(P)-dependent oxidoreductase [Rhodospirillaceae bacterium]